MIDDNKKLTEQLKESSDNPPDNLQDGTDNENDKNKPLESDANNLIENESKDKSDIEPEAEPVESRFNKIRNVLSGFFERCGFPDKLLLRFLGVYLIISGINYTASENDNINPITQWREFIENANVLSSFLWLALGFVLLTVLHFFIKKKYRVFDQLTAFAGIIIFSLSVMWRSSLGYNERFYLCLSIIAVCIVFTSYIVGKTRRSLFEKIPNWLSALIVMTAAAAVTAFVAVTSVAHHKTYGTSCYDFGIFVQMFHSMSSDLTAVTTCERDTFLSHFNIHASFIYYLLAPVYAIFPKPETLLVAQAILAMGGVVPLFLIAKKHNYKGLPLVFVCLIYVFCAGILSPCYYDFHENAFLPTLLLWLLYAADQRKIILFYIMSALTCIVKEDAPLYVICISLYLFFDEKKIKRINGIIMTLISGIYFMFITNWLTENGDGQMMAATRFGNLTVDPEAGFVGIIKNVLVDPAYFFSQFISRRGGDAGTPEEMLIFFLQILVPLLFLPLMTKKIRRFLLIIPFVIMNLVVGSGYGYASSIGYQYIFGPACLLIYMLLINCEDCGKDKRNVLVTCSAVASFIMTLSLISGNMSYYESYSERKEYYQEIEECLASVPEEASVVSNTWYLPHVANRDEVYILDNGDFDSDPYDESIKTLREIERYDVFIMSYYDDYVQQAAEQLINNGYTLFNEVDNPAGHVVIYASPEYSNAE